jgi:hypothetical protein
LGAYEVDEDTVQWAKQDHVLRCCDSGSGGPLWAMALHAHDFACSLHDMSLHIAIAVTSYLQS